MNMNSAVLTSMTSKEWDIELLVANFSLFEPLQMGPSCTMAPQ